MADMEANLKLSPIVTDLFLRGRKLNISRFFHHNLISKCLTIRLNTTYDFIIKIPNKRELQEIVSNHLPDIEFKDFMKLYKDYTKKPFSFFSERNNYERLPSDNPLKFRKNLL